MSTFAFVIYDILQFLAGDEDDVDRFLSDTPYKFVRGLQTVVNFRLFASVSLLYEKQVSWLVDEFLSDLPRILLDPRSTPFGYLFLPPSLCVGRNALNSNRKKRKRLIYSIR
jgi:hypothetical protein